VAEIEIDGDGCKIRIVTDQTTEHLSADEWDKMITNMAKNWKDMHGIVCARQADRMRLEADLARLAEASRPKTGAGTGFTSDHAWPETEVK
jgi:hypothetical protein